MDMRNQPQLERLLHMLWDEKNLELRDQVDKVRKGKVSRTSFARKFFDTEGEKNLLLFLNLLERNDQYALLIVGDMVEHSSKISPHDAYQDAIDLIADYQKD
jgi:hypothetical protein